MKIWDRFKRLFKSKKLKRRSTIPWYYLNKSNKRKGKMTERSVTLLYLELTGRVNGGSSSPGDLLIQYRKPHTKCLNIE